MSSAYYSPPAVAKLWGVSVHKVLGWLRRGELAGVNLADRAGGRPRWRISAESVAAFERARSSRPAPSPAPRRRKPSLANVTEYIR